MSTHKHIDRICCVAIVLALILTLVFLNAGQMGIQAASTSLGYEERLFDTSRVHTIDIVMDDWEGFLEGCTDEEYVLCSLVIDGESCKNVAIRAKGNTSLTQVASYGNDRYSFKVEFDHYDSSVSYHGLDKLSLNNIIQDNTYLKDYLTYQMMGYFGVDAPLCSYVYLTVNGEDWGLYLAVEGVEESFLERNYGSDYGELYKPDSTSMGGGRGNGGAFDMEDWMTQREEDGDTEPAFDRNEFRQDKMQGMEPPGLGGGEMPDGELSRGEMPQLPDGEVSQGEAQRPEGEEPATEEGGEAAGSGQTGGGRQFGGGTMGSDDVSLIYTDDDYDSYANIFDNAKTDITDADKDRLIQALKQLNAGENLESVVDVDEVIRYFVVHNFVCNFDSYTGSMIHNYYLYEEDGQLSMIPWDYNLAFGGFQGAQDATALVNYPIDTPVSGGTVDSRPMLAWIFASEEYTALYHQYFDQFITDYFDSGYFTQMMAQTKALIAPYVEQDPTKFCTYEEFETGFDTLEQFCLLRAQSIRGQLDGTIPATEEGQSADSSALVDASALTISDMGSMNNAMGGGMGGAMGREEPDSQAFEGGELPAPAGGTEPQTSGQETAQAPPDFSESGNMPQAPTENMEAEETVPADDSEVFSFRQDRGEVQNEQDPMKAGAAGGQAPVQTAGSWVLLATCGGVLLAGLLFAWRYRKRG